MRLWISLVLVLAAVSLWRMREQAPELPVPGDDEPVPAVGAAERPKPPDADTKPWQELDPRQLWREQAAADTPADPVVHCVGSPDQDAYLRQSDCEARGGHPDPNEPDWARID